MDCCSTLTRRFFEPRGLANKKQKKTENPPRDNFIPASSARIPAEKGRWTGSTPAHRGIPCRPEVWLGTAGIVRALFARAGKQTHYPPWKRFLCSALDGAGDGCRAGVAKGKGPQPKATASSGASGGGRRKTRAKNRQKRPQKAEKKKTLVNRGDVFFPPKTPRGPIPCLPCHFRAHRRASFFSFNGIGDGWSTCLYKPGPAGRTFLAGKKKILRGRGFCPQKRGHVENQWVLAAERGPFMEGGLPLQSILRGNGQPVDGTRIGQKPPLGAGGQWGVPPAFAPIPGKPGPFSFRHFKKAGSRDLPGKSLGKKAPRADRARGQY